MTRRQPQSDRQLLALVRNAVLASRANAPSDPLLVGVSGGPDSACLLHLLSRVRETLSCGLHVVHIQHGLRPGEGPDDAAFVSGFCLSLGIECTVEVCDTEAYRRQHPSQTSIEAAARSVRYGRFCERAAALGAATVAVGHTADDQVETVLMRLFRGSGTTGLSGMRWLSQWSEPGSGFTLNVLRPMLSVTKAETIAYCDRHGVQFRSDESNASLRFDRNRVRSEVLPVIRSVYPGIDAAMLRVAAASQTEDDFFNGEVERLFDWAQDPDSKMIRFPRPLVLGLPVALGARVLRRIYCNLIGKNPDARVLDLMIQAVRAGSGKHVDLPAGLSMETTSHFLVFERQDAQKRPVAPEPPVAMTPPGEVAWGGWTIRADLVDGPQGQAPTDGWTALFDQELIGGSLVIRQRGTGDRMAPVGMTGSKKIQDILVDAKVPRHWRDQMPLIESGGRILWVPGVRVSRHARVTAATLRTVRLTATAGSDVLAQLIAEWRPPSL